MGWRLAKSLRVLLTEANEVAPARSKTYDGTIGDAAHASRASRHNPNNAGVVCALDISHDPAHGMDTYDLFDYLRLHPHPDLTYVISNRRVAKRSVGWAVKAYTGSNAHDHHIHVAVGGGTDSEPTPPYDDENPWGLEAWKGQDDMTEEQERLLKLIRVSDVARSFDMAIIKAMLAQDDAKADDLESQKTAAVAKERTALGL